MIIFDECGKFEFQQNFVHMRRVMRRHELIYMVRGSMYLAQEDEHLTVKEGDVVFLRAGKLHYGYAPSPDKVEFYWVHFLTDDENELDLPLIAHFDNPAQIIRLFHQLFHFASISPTDADCATTLLLHGVKNEILGKKFPHLSLGGDVCNWIKEHFSENISVSSVAEHFGYSTDYISTRVKEKTGMSAKSYITHCRMQSAKQILLCSDLSVEEIAHQCGFLDSKAFFKVFKKSEGITPTQYRTTYPNAQNVGISIKRSV
ncbi:MAG: helix-turn-helix transcriptional regulator [Clostridia bacterium]|nr:helix-turn-helix transcriptional regulator [Clostridia bacterium]